MPPYGKDGEEGLEGRTDDSGRDRQRLGRRLRRARRQAGLRQAEAAAALGLSGSSLSEIERGGRRLDALLLVRAARLYRTDAAALVTGLDAAGALGDLMQLAGTLPEDERRQLVRMAEFLNWRRGRGKDR